MTQAQITRRIKKYQKAHEKGQITYQELLGFIEALAKEMKEAGL